MNANIRIKWDLSSGLGVAFRAVYVAFRALLGVAFRAVCVYYCWVNSKAMAEGRECNSFLCYEVVKAAACMA